MAMARSDSQITPKLPHSQNAIGMSPSQPSFYLHPQPCFGTLRHVPTSPKARVGVPVMTHPMKPFHSHVGSGGRGVGDSCSGAGNITGRVKETVRVALQGTGATSEPRLCCTPQRLQRDEVRFLHTARTLSDKCPNITEMVSKIAYRVQ